MILGDEKELDKNRFLFRGEKKDPKAVKAHKDRIYDIGFNANGSNLASASGDSKISLWDTKKSFSKLRDLKGHSDLVERISWHPLDPNILASVSEDRTTRLWDVRKKSCVSTQKNKSTNLNICWHPKGNMYASSSKGSVVTFYSYGNGTVQNKDVRKFGSFDYDYTHFSNVEVNEISWDQTGNVFMMTVSEKEHSMFLFDGNDVTEPQYSVHTHTGACFCLAVDPSGRYIGTGGADFLINILDSTEFAPLRTIKRIDGQINQMKFNRDGNYLAAALDKNYVNIYETTSGDLIQQIETSCIQFSVAWHPKKRILAFAGEDKLNKKDKYEAYFRVVGINDNWK